MKYYKPIYILSFLFVMLISCNSEKNGQIAIEPGYALLEGKVKENLTSAQEMKIVVTNICSAEQTTYMIPIASDGSFYYKIPLNYKTLAGLESFGINGIIPLTPNQKTVLNIGLNNAGDSYIEALETSGYSSADLQQLRNIMMDIIANKALIKNEIVTPEEYSLNVSAKMKEIKQSIDSNTVLSLKGKESLKNELDVFYTNTFLFDYATRMKLVYQSLKNENTLAAEEMPTFEVTKSYYSFLRECDLKDKEYISSTMYPFLLQTILTNKDLSIQRIVDQDISLWLDNTKATLADLVGFDSGVFYDLLVINEYTLQFLEMKALSDKQIENIKSYYNDNPIADILIAANNEVLSLSRKDSTTESSFAPKIKMNNFMNELFSRYNNKALVIDFWATWCGPCLRGIEEIEPIKEKYKNPDLVFIYISSPSSPKLTWEKMKINIPGDHYYVSKEVWEQFTDEYGLEAIPSYLFFNSKGELTDKYVGYPGSDKIEKAIKKLLP